MDTISKKQYDLTLYVIHNRLLRDIIGKQRVPAAADKITRIEGITLKSRIKSGKLTMQITIGDEY